MFHTFDLAGTYPQEFGVGMTLIEKDAGGMANAVRVIAEKVEEEVKKRLDAAATARKADVSRVAADNGNANALPPLLAYAIRLAAPHIIRFVVARVIAAVNDDIFQPEHATGRIPSAAHHWSGSSTSAQGIVTFRGRSGIYELRYDWNLV